MWAKFKAMIDRYRKVFDFSVTLLEELKKNSSVPAHFENQNAILFGVTELMKRSNQVQALVAELQKANQLINISAVELSASTARVDDMQRALQETRDEVAQLREEMARLSAGR